MHPTKTEVKFEDSKAIYSILRSVIKKSLGSYTLTPQISDNQIFSFETSSLPESEVISKFNSPNVNSKYNPFSTDIQPNKRQDWGKLLEPFKKPESNFYDGAKNRMRFTPSLKTNYLCWKKNCFLTEFFKLQEVI